MSRDDLDDFFGRGSGTRTLSDHNRPARRTEGRAAARQGTRRTREASTRTGATRQRPVRPTSAVETRRQPRRTPSTRPAEPSRPSNRTRPLRPVPPVRQVRPVRPVIPPVDHATAMQRTRRRLIGFVVVVTLLVVAVTVKLVDVQATQRSFWVDRGERARDAERVIPAGRGEILDRNGHVLAISVSRPNVVADPSQITDPAERTKVAAALAPLLGSDQATLLAKLGRGDTHYQLLAPAVADSVERKVRALISEGSLPGIAFEPTYVREYPAGDIAPALVGRTYNFGQQDPSGRQGRYGLERSLDDRLRGVDGRISYEQDRAGGKIADTPQRVTPAKPGDDVYLTIDASLQYATQQALIEQVEATGAAEAMAVITKPSTGEILAISSVARVGDEVAPTVDDRAATTVFEPGSVNKMITVAGALEDGVVAPDTLLEVPDNLTLYDHTFTDHDPHPTRTWSTTDILVTSSNIGTIKIARQLGKERVDHYLRSFGLGHRTGNQIPGEVNGLMLDPDEWSGTSIGAIPIGQGISVTALQMLAAYNVVANDGVWVEPRILGAVDPGSGKVVEPTGEARRVVSPATAAAMREMLAKVVSEGTGSKAQVPGYTAYGKTGTARIPQDHPTDPHDAYRNAAGGYDYQSTFLGGIEGADLSAIVTVRQAKTSIYGGEVAAPVFAKLALTALRTLGIAPPALAGDVDTHVPALSSTAREVDAEGPSSGPSTAQG